jgi:hypothetical protein
MHLLSYNSDLGEGWYSMLTFHPEPRAASSSAQQLSVRTVLVGSQMGSSYVQGPTGPRPMLSPSVDEPESPTTSSEHVTGCRLMTNPEVSKLQSVKLPTPCFVFSLYLTKLMNRQGTNITILWLLHGFTSRPLLSEHDARGGQPGQEVKV